MQQPSPCLSLPAYLTKKIPAPVVGDAPAVGSSAAGSAACVGNKANDAKVAVTGTGSMYGSSSYTTIRSSYKIADKIVIPVSYRDSQGLPQWRGRVGQDDHHD
ncbi:hypothetical protein BGZ81_000618 [Podila clonocystis]|nr:hypothetical protein BGZ81_000618 [Podila clonocystis]